jgi:predicted MFS family arabinose efflux permease
VITREKQSLATARLAPPSGSKPEQAKRETGPFRRELRVGWRNLLAACIGLSVGVGGYFPISSLFLRSLEEQFGWSKGIAAGALIALPITALALPIAGRLIDRFGVRRTSAFSILAVALSYSWLACLHGDVTSYYLAILALNVLGCATGPVAYTRLIAAQFSAARGAALALAQFGIALFGTIMPAVLGTLLAHGYWRDGYWLLAAASLIGGGLAQLLMKPSQTKRELVADGKSEAEAVGSSVFWILGCAILAISMATMGIIAHGDTLLLERGLSSHEAALLLSLTSIAVAASRLLVGRLLDLEHPHRSAAAVVAVAAAGSALLLAGFRELIPVAIGIALVGCGIGAELDFLSFFCARSFGTRRYASIYGLLSVFFYTGMAVGGIGYGIIRDRLGSYSLGLGLSTGLLIFAALLFLRLGSARTVHPIIPDCGDRPMRQLAGRRPQSRGDHVRHTQALATPASPMTVWNSTSDSAVRLSSLGNTSGLFNIFSGIRRGTSKRLG